MGLSVVGIGVVGGGGLLLVGVLLGAIAWGTGWLDARPGPGGPVVVGPGQDPDRFTRARPLGDAAQQKVQRAVRELAPEMAERCGKGANVTADLLVDTSGKVVYAKVSPTGLGGVDPQCVKKGLEFVRVRGGVAAEGVAKVSVRLQ
jgi:hypothetical protein